MKEIWKDIPNYEGMYQASNLGNIKSLDRKVKNKHGYRFVLGRILNKNILKDGYYYVSLYGNKTLKPVHQLIAMTFLNHVPCKFKIVVDHIDNNKLNNNLNNLQLLTNRENSTKDSFNKCGYLGVSKSNKKFKASIRINGVAIYLGSFDTAKLAHEKYKSARIKHEINNLHK